MTPEEIAQWIINNRYPKSENEKVSDHEMFHFVREQIEQYTTQREAEEVRPQVMRFAQKMEEVLKQNDHKGGWEGCDDGFLLGLLNEEVKELESALTGNLTKELTQRECADVANFAMMIFDNAITVPPKSNP